MPADPPKKHTFSATRIAAACMVLGIDPAMDLNLLHIAEEFLSASLPDGWVIYEDDRGRIYYYNMETEITQWQHPLEEYYRGVIFMNKDGRAIMEYAANKNPPLPEEVREMAQYLGIDVRAEAELVDVAKAAVIAPLPPGWEEFEDADGIIKYYHKATENQQTRHPLDGYFHELVDMARVALSRKKPNNLRRASASVFGGDPTLPHPWKEFLTKGTKKPYYYNFTTDEVMFSHPASLQQQDRLHEAATTIQRYVRGHVARVRHRALFKRPPPEARTDKGIAMIKQSRAVMACLVIQKYWRGFLGRRTAFVRRQDRAVVRIQSFWRGFVARSTYRRIRGEFETVDMLPPPLQAQTAAIEVQLDAVLARVKAYVDLGGAEPGQLSAALMAKPGDPAAAVLKPAPSGRGGAGGGIPPPAPKLAAAAPAPPAPQQLQPAPSGGARRPSSGLGMLGRILSGTRRRSSGAGGPEAGAPAPPAPPPPPPAPAATPAPATTTVAVKTLKPLGKFNLRPGRARSSAGGDGADAAASAPPLPTVSEAATVPPPAPAVRERSSAAGDAGQPPPPPPPPAERMGSLAAEGSRKLIFGGGLGEDDAAGSGAGPVAPPEQEQQEPEPAPEAAVASRAPEGGAGMDGTTQKPQLEDEGERIQVP